MTISHTNPQRLPIHDDAEVDSHGPITRIGEDRLLEAVMRLLAVKGEVDRVRAERFISFSRANQVPLKGMWSRLEEADGRIVHTVLAVPSPGRTAMFFATRPRRASEVEAIAGLIDHATVKMGEGGVHLAQALLDPIEIVERDAFLRADFTELARLSYLERPLTKGGRVREIHWPDGVGVEAYCDELEDELIGVLDASYEDTLDCPGLRGLRETCDILAGHKGTGAFDPRLWTILRVADRPAGALLLNPSPAQRCIELVYLGLAKFARGRGLGRLLLRHGLSLVRRRSERKITLAVDDRNAPALSLYQREGFRRVLRRVALIRRTATNGLSADASSDPASA